MRHPRKKFSGRTSLFPTTIEAKIQFLKRSRLFSTLPRHHLEAIASITEPIKLAAGEFLFYEGESAKGFYLVISGAIAVQKITQAGKENVLHVFRANDSFAEAAVALGTYPAEARAIEDSSLLFIPKDRFLTVLRSNPNVAMGIIGSLSSHLVELVDRLEEISSLDVTSRLVRWLLAFCKDKSGDQPVAITLAAPKRLLATELGTTAETLSRSLAKLKAAGFITVKGRTIIVNSPDKLKSSLETNLAIIGENPSVNAI